MDPWIVMAMLFGSVAVAMVLGVPISFALGGVGIIFTFFLWGPEGLGIFAGRVFVLMGQFLWIAVPLFIFMGLMLQRSGVIDILYECIYGWFDRLRGGLAAATVIICTLMAAMTGISGASTVTMGVIALPEMLKRKYDKSIAVGCIAAGGALGILIPPSVLMIIWGLYARVSIGKLFMGGLFPGLLLSTLFLIYIFLRSYFQKDLAPSIPIEDRVSLKVKLAGTRSLILPGLLVVAVLGSIFLGITTPSEAASVGAAGSLVYALGYRKLTWQSFKEASYETMKITTMVMWIVCGAQAFLTIYLASGTQQVISDVMLGLPGGRYVVLAIIQLTFFVLGCVLDQIGIVMITTPVYMPIITALGFDPVWFGILFVVNMEMAYITPPFGYNLFYLKSVVPEGITTVDIYRAVVPFIGLQAIGLILVIVFPQIALWLPSVMFGLGQ